VTFSDDDGLNSDIRWTEQRVLWPWGSWIDTRSYKYGGWVV